MEIKCIDAQVGMHLVLRRTDAGIFWLDANAQEPVSVKMLTGTRVRVNDAFHFDGKQVDSPIASVRQKSLRFTVQKRDLYLSQLKIGLQAEIISVPGSKKSHSTTD